MSETRVLVVDDEKEMGELLCVSLAHRGFVPKAAMSAERGLELLSETPFDVVVTDVHMRGMSGVAFCTKILETHPDMPVLVVTAFGSIETAVASMRAGAVDFVTKPFDIDDLARAIERALHEAEKKRIARRANAPAEGELVSLDEVEKRYIERVMRAVSWNKVHAARILKMDRTTLYRKLDRYDLSSPVGDE